MGLRNRIAFACITIPALVEIGLGVVYFTATEVMPYHREALDVDWSQIEPGTRALLLTLLNGYGSAHFATGVALLLLVGIPLRRGAPWARWAILATGLPVLGATAFLSSRLAAITGSSVPWEGSVVLLLVFLAGVALVSGNFRAGPDLPATHRGEK